MITVIAALALLAAADTGLDHHGEQCAGAVETVDSAYVDGIWRLRDKALVYAGFHEDFVMQARRDGEMRSMSIEDWIGGWPDDLGSNEADVEAKLALSQCDGTMATVRVDLAVDGNPRFVDVLALYKFDDEWKIVAKVYQAQ
ncbi:nuclear transport factor 2 family protein [Sphingomicrobium sediminis]|uniref:Nuclear transport factor 2 family protein n=1 Tax=Sphingomicrobium sediminis TaxID=2950949 RepID=A0A9X2EHR2_9SPHN|nr:nuclear transport factor 2 family protein [Sphingomicrobium sediminis]MCM8558240.1 nuclear transport factor 2 family protein [Sphingomicrobium sediminis]